MLYSRTGLLKVLVDFDVREWPFDHQVVNITIATKDHSNNRLNITFAEKPLIFGDVFTLTNIAYEIVGHETYTFPY